MKRPSSNFALLSGLLFGAATWTSPAALWLSAGLTLPLIDRRWPPRARLHLAASALVGLALVLLPRLFRV